MGYNNAIDLGTFTGTGAGTAKVLDAINLDKAQVFAFGGSMTYAVQVSAEGTNWINAKNQQATLLQGLTPDRVDMIEGDAHQVRINVTAFTSGSMSVKLVPNTSRHLGSGTL